MYVQGGTASACRAGDCDLVTQQGCADAQKCGYVEDGGDTARSCVPDGTADAGEACSVDGVSCLRGLGCVGDPGGGATGTCAHFCYTDSDCADSEECGDEFLVYEGTDETPSFCSQLLPTCDLLNQGSCSSASPTQGCYSGTHHPICLPVGTAVLGASCLVSNDCASGLQCMGLPPNAICRQLCRLPGGTPQCPSGSTCTQVDIPGGAGVGVCL